MNKYMDIAVSNYTRTLYNGDWCVVGNIATDGRWIKIPKKLWENVLILIEEKNIEEMQTAKYQNLLDALYKIHVLVKSQAGDDEFQNIIKPHDITIEVTTQCNLKCKHCSYSFGREGHTEVSSELIVQLSKWCSNNKVERLILTGGEPFCKKDFLELLNMIREVYSGSLEIMTNASLISTHEIESILKNVNRLHISLDGFDEYSVSSIRGRNVFSKVIQVILELKNNDFNKISLSCVDTGDSKKIERFIELSKKMEVTPVIRKLNLKGQASKNFHYKDSDFNEIISVNGVNMKSICNHVYSSLFINTKGEIFPCSALRELEYNVGKFLSDDMLFEINKKTYTPLVDKIEKCSKCSVRYFCSTPCISQNDVIYLNKNYLEKRCEDLYDKLFNIIWNS